MKETVFSPTEVISIRLMFSGIWKTFLVVLLTSSGSVSSKQSVGDELGDSLGGALGDTLGIALGIELGIELGLEL